MEKKTELEPNPLDGAGILSKITFSCLLPLFRKGFKRPIDKGDLFQVRKKQSSATLGDRLSKNWDEEFSTAKINDRKPSLIRVLFRTFGLRFCVMGIFIGLDQCFIRMVQTMCIGGLIKYFNKDPSFSEDYIGYLFAFVIVFCSVAQMSLVHGTYWGLQNLGMEMRVAICNLLYRKVLRLSCTALGQTTVGQMVNLLSNDVNRFDMCMTKFHHIWIGPIQTIIITTLMWQVLGPTCLIAVIFPILNVPFQGFISKVYSRLVCATALLTDERIGLTNEAIRIMRSIKMFCWEGIFNCMVKESRRKEVKKLVKTNYYIAFNGALLVIGGKFVFLATILAYILLGNTITTEKAFLTMIFIRYINDTMIFLFPLAITNIAEAFISCKRIQKFLVLEEKEISTNSEQNEYQPKLRECFVEVTDASARWISTSEKDDLNGITFTVKAGQLLAVVGPVGAGKSSLLHAMMGELPINSGSIKIKGKVAYVSQEPWLFTGTIRQNIRFGQPFHARKYKQVIKACALEKDFMLFPNKDQTIVGEKGDALSGGQKARISLARAVYFDADIYLLDDPLSAVDSHVGKQLFEQCILKFLAKKVCILVTHQLQYIKSVTQILVLQNGIQQRNGVPNDLKEPGIDLKTLRIVQEEFVEQAKGTTNVLPIIRSKSCWEFGDTNAPCSKFTRFKRDSQAWHSFRGYNEQVDEIIGESILELSNNEAGARRMTLSLIDEYVLEDSMAVKSLSNNETKKTGALDKSTYIKYLKAGGGGLYLATLAAMFIIKHTIYEGVDYWMTYWLKQERKSGSLVLSDPISGKNTSFANEYEDIPITFHERYLYLGIYAGLVAALIIATFMQSVLYVRLCAAASENLHLRMFSALHMTKMRFFDKHPIGQILNRFSNDIGKVDVLLPTTLFEFIKNALFCVGSFGIVSSMNYWMLFPFLLIVGCMLFLRSVYLSSAREIRRLEGIMRSPVFSHLSNSLLGLSTIRSFKAQNQLIKEFEGHQDTHTSVWYLFLATTTCFCIWMDTLAVGYVCFTTFSFFGKQGEAMGSDFGLSITSALLFSLLFMWAVRQSVEVEDLMISVERVLEYTKLEPENTQEAEKEMKKTDWPNAGHLSFQNVYLTYEQDDPPVLKDVSFEIQAGQKIGIVGRTGAGKSSILTCLLRLTNHEGKIKIDNVNSNSLILKTLRESISVIPQVPTLFKGTIRQNLDLLSNYSDDELWNALEEVDLKKVINKLPEGLSALVNQGGDNFSIGQRQLICLARAILKNNKILVMDEATANMDPQTDNKIQNIIRVKFSDCTVLTIAHRIHTIIDSDKVIVMDAGEVKEFSSPHELLQDNKSLFSELIRGTDPSNEKQLRKAANETYNSRCLGCEQ